MNKILYKFYWDCGRQGSIYGLFISDKETVSKNMGKQAYFGSCLGKYSEIYGYLEDKDLTILTEDQDFIEKFEKYVGKSFGKNPLSNINE
jgi:hypothetical protein